MRSSIKDKEIRARAHNLGVEVEVSRPGDGVSRYEFVGRKSGRVVGFCHGRREAEVWLRGFEEGWTAVMERTLPALANTIPLLVRLGDFIGNGEMRPPVGYAPYDRCKVVAMVNEVVEASQLPHPRLTE